MVEKLNYLNYMWIYTLYIDMYIFIKYYPLSNEYLYKISTLKYISCIYHTKTRIYMPHKTL